MEKENIHKNLYVENKKHCCNNSMLGANTPTLVRALEIERPIKTH
jgi:hypothetical protein